MKFLHLFFITIAKVDVMAVYIFHQASISCRYSSEVLEQLPEYITVYKKHHPSQSYNLLFFPNGSLGFRISVASLSLGAISL
jgi:hypothetical protein